MTAEAITDPAPPDRDASSADPRTAPDSCPVALDPVVARRPMPTLPVLPPLDCSTVDVHLDLPRQARRAYLTGVLGSTDKKLLGSCRRIIAAVATGATPAPANLNTVLAEQWHLENATNRATEDDTGMRTAHATVRGWALTYLQDYLPLGAQFLGSTVSAFVAAQRVDNDQAVPHLSDRDPHLSWRLPDGRVLFDELHVSPYADCLLDGWMRRRIATRFELADALFGDTFVGVRLIQLRPPFAGAFVLGLGEQPRMLPLSEQPFAQGVWS